MLQIMRFVVTSLEVMGTQLLDYGNRRLEMDFGVSRSQVGLVVTIGSSLLSSGLEV